MKRVSPSRTPKKRREAYERNLATVKAWEQRRKETPDYARAILAREMGVLASEVPDQLVEMRFEQIKLRRAVREAQSDRLYPVIRKRYLAGATIKDLRAEYGFDAARLSQIIQSAGITLKRRPVCKRGHMMDEANTAYTPQGWRRCRKCACLKTREHYARKKAAKT